MKIIHFRNGIVFDFSVLLICCLSFGFSWIESKVNIDSLHWGLMYVQALDIKRGLIPHKEIFIAYGILTSYIQSFSLTLFGERLISVGLATGIFYSLSLFLSYKLFLKILPKYAAFFSTFVVFLLHGYIIFPWSNYYSYTFFLLSLLMFFKGKKSINVFLSGLLLGLSLLCRYSSVQAILPPFLFFFVYEALKKNTRKTTLSRILFFSLGFLIPTLLFFFFLIYNGALNDLLIQTKIMISDSAWDVTILNSLLILLKSIITSKAFGGITDSRVIFFTINFFWVLLTLFYFLHQLFLKKNLTQNETLVMAFCIVTLFGYLNAIHIYDLFRLVNGPSLGIAVIIYTIVQTSQQLGRKIKIIILLPLISICFIWANSLIFSKSSSVYYPWRLDTLIGKRGVPTEISILRGKILTQEYYEFYREVFDKISKFDHSYYIVNYTSDVTAMAINDLPRVQISSYYIPEIEQAYPEEAKKIKQIIDAKKAIIISNEDLHIPGYKVVFYGIYTWQTWQGEENHEDRDRRYISVPE